MLLPYVDRVGVGSNEEEPVASVRGAETGRGKTRPLRIEPERGQVPEYVSERSVSINDAWGVLHDDVARSSTANGVTDRRPNPPLVVLCSLEPGSAGRWAREPGSEDVAGHGVEGVDVVPDCSSREPTFEDGAPPTIKLAELDGSESSPLKTEVKEANA